MTWPKVSAAITEATLAIYTASTDHIQEPVKFFFITGLMLSLVFSCISLYYEYKDLKKSASVGELKAKRSFTDFKSFKYTYSADDNLGLKMGHAETVLLLDFKTWINPGTNKQGVDPTKPVQVVGGVDADHSVFFWIEEGQPRLGIKLSNRNNDLVAEINGSHWYAKRDLLYDLNYDKEAIEVRDSQGKIQLQVVFYTNMIQLSIVNYDSRGGFFWGSTRDGHGTTGGFPLDGEPPIEMNPIFKYPSLLYHGVRV